MNVGFGSSPVRRHHGHQSVSGRLHLHNSVTAGCQTLNPTCAAAMPRVCSNRLGELSAAA
eukprot:352144-Chlamydomonas_euryale.AAC.1